MQGREGSALCVRILNIYSPSPSLPYSKMMMLPTFRLSIILSAPASMARLRPAKLILDLGLAGHDTCAALDPIGHANDEPLETMETPATSKRKESFNYDLLRGEYPLQWSDFNVFEDWHHDEEIADCIKLISSTTTPRNSLWMKRYHYVCGRALSGGKSKYELKHLEQYHKESKKIGCGCQVIIKQYLHTPIILGQYDSKHDHSIGIENLVYTRMSHEARERINKLLAQKINNREVVCNGHLAY
jgi:hypothetical protein